MAEVEDFLAHYGIPGMKWGHRKASDSGVSRSTNRLAAKDAKRHTDAKMFYGKGAGTRRKLLKAEIDRKHEKVPGYSQAFNSHLGNQNLAKSAKKATRERKARDIQYRTRVTTKQVLGVTGPLTVAAAMAYSQNKPVVDAAIKRHGARLISEAVKLSQKVR